MTVKPQYVAQATYLLNEPRTGDLVRGVLPIADPYGGTSDRSPDLAVDGKPARRGTTNGNARGNNEARRRRREWLVACYRADADVTTVFGDVDPNGVPVLLGAGTPACRCYRCGRLLTADTVTVDRIVPGCQGGTYRRENIRPACGPCNSETGGSLRRKK